jgi:methylmalonyl-CoA mutase
VGGAQAITALPFDSACGLPDNVSRRIARNTQILLAEESHVAAVADPAGGSWYVEDLTDQLARAAWAVVQAVEDAGGMPVALGSGLVGDRLAVSRAALDDDLAHRRLSLTGVSSFPLAGEQPIERRPRPHRPVVGGLPRRRDSAVFEALRDRSRAASARGRPPTVALATLGSQRDFGPRQTFAANLLAVAGISTVVTTAPEPATIAEKAAKISPFVVLCSSPRGYAEHAHSLLPALRAAGVRHVHVAGRLAELGEAADQVDGSLADGMDVLGYLSSVLDLLEVER